MQLILPVQGAIDRSKPYEPFLVMRPFVEDDGTLSLMRGQVGGYYGHDVGDPSPLLCHDTRDTEGQLVPGSTWGGWL
ncbi:hypothetical protein ACIRPT_03045 [Streptomyces sp. NPDC101227]|uniref:hypothetical protein n=1 Tax=Streptomyces sp. NPDC101227 TaxID=3366136 RepID=UPI00380CBD82